MPLTITCVISVCHILRHILRHNLSSSVCNACHNRHNLFLAHMYRVFDGITHYIVLDPQEVLTVLTHSDSKRLRL